MKKKVIQLLFLLLSSSLFAQVDNYPKKIQSNMKQFLAWSARASKTENETTRKDYAKRAAKYLQYAKKKAPNYDFSAEQKKIDNILDDNIKLGGKSFLRKQRSLIAPYYEEGNFFSHEAFFRPKFLEDVKKFNRTKINQELEKLIDSQDVIVQNLRKIVNDYHIFIERTNVRGFFMTKFNEIGGRADTKNPAYTLKEAKKIKQILLGIESLAGNKTSVITELYSLADEIIIDNEQLLKSIVTSDFHLKHIGQILFSNKPVKIGSESTKDFKKIFTPGEEIYATIYFGRTLESLFAGDVISRKATHLTPLYIKNNENLAMGPNEGWEVSQFMAKENICYPASNLGQSYFQFLVVPNEKTNVEPYVKISNYSPVTFMHGLSRTSSGTREFELYTNKPDRNGVVSEYKGNFKIDMSKNGGKNYYNTFKEEIIYEYIKNEPWPISSAFRDSNLESQAISIMGNMIGDVKFKSARITSNWDVKLVYGVKQRSIDIAVAGGKNINPKKPKQGFCYYRVYTFIDTGSGKLQRKSNGPMIRITCDKL